MIAMQLQHNLYLYMKPKILLVALIFSFILGLIKLYPYVLLNLTSVEIVLPLPDISPRNSNVYIRWSMGRALLRHNKEKTALAFLDPLSPYAKTNQLLLVDILDAQVINKNFLEVVDLYQQVQDDLYPTQLISDTVAIAYIGLGKYSTAIDLRPQDLYINYQLWKKANSTLKERFHDSLTHFSVDGLLPSNNYLLENTLNIIPELYTDGVWSTDTLMVAVSHLLWRSSTLPLIEKLLVDLEPKLDKKIISNWRQEVVFRHSDTKRELPNNLPCIPGENYSLGGINLLESTRLNSSVVLSPTLESFWQWGVSDGIDHRNALFVAGLDVLYSNSTIRIDGLWHKYDSNQTELPYAEFASKSFYLEPLQDYTMSVCYRTSTYGNPQAFIALLEYRPNPTYIFTHTTLPATDGKWRSVSINGKGPNKTVPLRLILRMSDTGTVWYDNVYLTSRPNN